MARFNVTLYVSHLPTAIVSKEIRRETPERAILYAENWLKRSRKSGHYFTTWYDRWRVKQHGVDGGDQVIAKGSAVDTEAERLAAKPKPKKATKAPRKTIPTVARSDDPWLADLPKINRRLPSRDYLPIRRLGKTQSKSGSARERILAMRETAKRRLAERGNILPMGSDQDG
jgi:hypothetical protein